MPLSLSDLLGVGSKTEGQLEVVVLLWSWDGLFGCGGGLFVRSNLERHAKSPFLGLSDVADIFQRIVVELLVVLI